MFVENDDSRIGIYGAFFYVPCEVPAARSKATRDGRPRSPLHSREALLTSIGRLQPTVHAIIQHQADSSESYVKVLDQIWTRECFMTGSPSSGNRIVDRVEKQPIVLLRTTPLSRAGNQREAHFST